MVLPPNVYEPPISLRQETSYLVTEVSVSARIRRGCQQWYTPAIATHTREDDDNK